jgi:pimeloyl-ACP methyl ester carboxylesterase
VEDYFGDLLEFMAAIGLNSAIWIGHSMGGAIALHAAAHYPHRVLGLGLVASGERLRVDGSLLSLTSQEAAFPSALKLIAERSFSDSADPRLKQVAMQRMGEMRSTVLHGDLVACNAFDVSAHLHSIRVPTLIISGADDRMISPRVSESLRSAISNSQLLVMPDTGHMVMLERPDETASAVGRFVDSVNYKPGVSTA